MNCPICNHESHEAGKCKNCNCGEDELIVSQLKPRDLKAEKRRDSFNTTSTEMYGYNKGRRVKPKKRQ